MCEDQIANYPLCGHRIKRRRACQNYLGRPRLPCNLLIFNTTLNSPCPKCASRTKPTPLPIFNKPIPVKQNEITGVLRIGKEKAVIGVKRVVGSVRKLKPSRLSSFLRHNKQNTEVAEDLRAGQKLARLLTVHRIEEKIRWKKREDALEGMRNEVDAERSSSHDASLRQQAIEQDTLKVAPEGQPNMSEADVVPRSREWTWESDTIQRLETLQVTQEKRADSALNVSSRYGFVPKPNLRASEELAEEYRRALDRHPSLSEEHETDSRFLRADSSSSYASHFLKTNADVLRPSPARLLKMVYSHKPNVLAQMHFQHLHDRASNYSDVTTVSGLMRQAQQLGGSWEQSRTPANDGKLGFLREEVLDQEQIQNHNLKGNPRHPRDNYNGQQSSGPEKMP